MDVVEQIRQASSILEIASQYTTLQKRGSKYVGLCPFHAERDPSFTLDPDKQLYHCFGCGAGGDIFALVMEKESLSFPEAVKYLAERYHIPLPQRSPAAARTQKIEEQLVQIHEQASSFFRRHLHETEEGKTALNYLHRRGLSDETIEKLRLGYAPNSWTALVEHFSERRVSPELLVKAGLAVPGRKKAGWFDRFRGRVMFPIFNITGKTIAFGGRALQDVEPKYLNSPETPIYSKGRVLYGLNFTKEAVRAQEEMILVEGYTDFTALYQAGFVHCAASLGTSLTPAQTALARRFAPRMIVNYDGDAAGRRAALRAVSLCFEQGLDVSVVVLPGGHDPDGYLRRFGPDAYRKILDQKRTGLEFLVEAHTGGKPLKTPEAKTAVLRNLLAEVDKIPDPIIKSEYVKNLSALFDVKEEFVRTQLKTTEAGTVPASAPFLYAEKRLIQILLRDPDFIPAVLAECLEDDFTSLRSEEVFKAVRELHGSDSPVTPQALSSRVDRDLWKRFSGLLLEPCEPPSLEEALDCLMTLRKIRLDSRLRELQAKIIETERKGDWDVVRELISRRDDLTRLRMSL